MRLLPKLPKLALPRRNPSFEDPAPPKTESPKDRAEALKMMRARVTGEDLPPATPPVVPQAQPAPSVAPAAAPTQAQANVVDPAQAPAASQTDKNDPLKAMSEAADSLDSDLLDIFIEAKSESEDSGLAASLEDIGIRDLLGEVLQIGRRLGVHAPAPRAAQQQDVKVEVSAVTPGKEATAEAAPPDEPPSPAESEAEGDEPSVVALEDALQPQGEPPQPAVHVVPAGPDPEDQPAAPDEPEEEPVPPVRRIEAQDPTMKMSARRDLHGRYLAMVAAFGIGLALMTSYGIALATEPDGAAASAGTAVLSIVEIPRAPPVGTARVLRPEPVIPQVGEAAAYVPTAPLIAREAGGEAESGSFDADRPAFILYTVESGDTLTSIANQFEICPDHVMWNNEGSEESLRVGDELLLPGYPGILHELRKGETLEQVASLYNTTVARVIAYPGNHLKSAGDAEEGTLVLLPGGFPSSALADTAEGSASYRPPSEFGYIWPFFGPITTLFGEPRPGYIHTAIDIGGLGRWGAPVSAIAAGRVVQVEHRQSGLGNFVVLEHPDGSRSLYAHLAETWVESGDSVSQGAHLGPIGCTGLSTGTHLHFQLWREGKPVDPLQYLPLLDSNGRPQN